MNIKEIQSILPLLLISPSYSQTNPAVEKPAYIQPASLRSSHRKMGYLLAEAPQVKPQGIYVGELQEKWQFPSDHLPIGMTLDGIHITSWNVLEEESMDWVTEKDSQGLKRSMIGDEHIYIGDSKLTVRDQHTVGLILEMINHPTHPRSLLALQECSESFLGELRSRLPSHFEVSAHEGNAVVIDRRCFEIIEAKSIGGIFSKSPERTFQSIDLRRVDTGETMKIFNLHLPGNPKHPARYEFMQYLSTMDRDGLTIAMGDMNFNELEMTSAMNQAFEESPFTLYSPYCTNIGVRGALDEFTSKAIDHFLISGKSEVQILKPEEVLIGFTATYELLN